MRKAVIFEEFAYQCDFFLGETDEYNGYACKHKENEPEYGEEIGGCYCHKCPLGIEAEPGDLKEPVIEIDWDGLCEDGKVTESEYLLVDVGESATEEQKQALYNYEWYMNRYNKKWLDEHGIPNSLCN